MSYLIVFLALTVVLRARVEHLTPIQVTAIQGHDQNLGRGNVGGNGDVIQVAHPQQLVLGFIVHSRGACVAEIQERVDLVVSDTGCDLLLLLMVLLNQ